MLKRSMARWFHFRGVLAAVLMVLLLAPMAAAFAAAVPQQHSCCKDTDEKATPLNPEQCCYISNSPGPAPVASAPARTPAGEHQVLAAVSRITVASNKTSEYVAWSELAPSPPVGPNCSSILRI